MTGEEIVGTELDTELGTTDRTVRFTTTLRLRYANEGQRVFNEQTNCYVRRAQISIREIQEINLEQEAVGDFTPDDPLTDYIRPAKTSATLVRNPGTADFTYVEGPNLLYTTEEELNQTSPNWRAASAGVPSKYYIRFDGQYTRLGFDVVPDIPTGETWTLYFPYVAVPPDMAGHGEEPYTPSEALSTTRETLRPYHRAIVHYAAAQLEKLRKNWEGVERQMKLFAAYVAKYQADQAPARGSSIRLRQDYRARLRTSRPLDPTRWP